MTVGLKRSLLCLLFWGGGFSSGRDLLFNSLVDLWVLFVEFFVRRISQVKEQALGVVCVPAGAFGSAKFRACCLLSVTNKKWITEFPRAQYHELLKAFSSLDIASSLHTHQSTKNLRSPGRRPEERPLDEMSFT